MTAPEQTPTSSPPFDVLLLDFGGVCLLSPVELHAKTERVLGLAPGSLDWLGPLDPGTDPLWTAMVSGDGPTERGYWHQRASEIGDAAGRDLTLRDYMALIYNPPSDELIRPEATRVVDAARRAGYTVSVLTNDLAAFHGPDWAHDVDFLRAVDHLVDCSDTGILKPDPRAFARTVDIIGVEPERILFVDDQPLNVEGGSAFGLSSMWFDIAHADRAWLGVAERLGLDLN